MYYYQIALLKSPLDSLTYASDVKLVLGMLVEGTLSKRTIHGVVLEEVAKPSFSCEKVHPLKDAYYSKSMIRLARFISEYYICSLGEALALFTPFTQYNSFSANNAFDTSIQLSSEQQKAYDFIEQHPSSLLFGDTGSGKTEIYMKLFEATIQEGKQALFLLPEIGLTPQMKGRLKKHFGEKVAIWHSKISAKKKQEILTHLQSGSLSIIAGTRSALFLPFSDLGVIVVDEEHDESYKSNARPRYHARDLSLLFGQKLGCKVVLGSATPTLGSYQKVPHYRLKGTYHEASRHLIYDDDDLGLSQFVIDRIERTLHAKRQVVVFLPTRANFKYISCKQCNATVECPYCSVGMSVHHGMHALKCHYCNYTEVIPKACPKCGCEEIVATRMGTAEVCLKLKEHFKTASVQQFDRDEVRTEKQLATVLSDFNEHSIDILVGTQMLSKGHDYHGVGLAVILGVDALLNMSDFRAREKTLALVTQIAGRSGRKGHGDVVIQTKNSDFFKQYLHHYDVFIHDELVFRRSLYPPFKKMLRLLSSHTKEEKAKGRIDDVMTFAQGMNDIDVVGYGKASIGKIAGKFRYEILLRSDSSKALIVFAHRVKHLGLEADMDPLSFS